MYPLAKREGGAVSIRVNARPTVLPHGHARHDDWMRLVTTTIACVALSGLPACRLHPTASPMLATPVHAQQTSRPFVAVDGIRFENVAEAAGLRYRWPIQPRPIRILEAFGCGCAFLDYDDDGWPDILLVASPHPVLYRNLGNGRFEDVTEATGLADVQGDWRGCAVGDYDGDGYPDVVLTGYRRLALLHNVGVQGKSQGTPAGGETPPLHRAQQAAPQRTPGLDSSRLRTEGGASPAPTQPSPVHTPHASRLTPGRRFVDVTVAAGFDPHNRGHWASSAGFMDLAGQGRLDLVLLNYVVFGPQEPQYCEVRAGVRSGCPPSTYRPEFSELW